MWTHTGTIEPCGKTSNNKDEGVNRKWHPLGGTLGRSLDHVIDTFWLNMYCKIKN